MIIHNALYDLQELRTSGVTYKMSALTIRSRVINHVRLSLISVNLVMTIV